MYFLYADESGDAGHNTSVTRFYTIAALVTGDADWLSLLNKIKQFRKALHVKYGIPVRSELHGTELWKNKGKIKLSMAGRRQVFRDIALAIRTFNELEIIIISMDKSLPKWTGVNLREYAWKILFQRYENFLLSKKENGVVYIDGHEDGGLTRVLRKMRIYNPIPSQYGRGYRRIEVRNILEDPSFRDSADSYFIQLTDIVAYLARLRDNSTQEQRKWELHKLYKTMRPRYNLKAGPQDKFGFKYP
jgi:hypothetical protein